MLEKPQSGDTRLLKHHTQATSFSIDSLLDKSKGVVDPVKPPLPSPPPILHPGHLLLPHLLPPPPGHHQPGPGANETGGLLSSNLPFDLLARTYMSGILGEIIDMS